MYLVNNVLETQIWAVPLLYLVLKKKHQKNGASRRTILNFMFVNDEERQKNEKFFKKALKKMVASKELIECTMKTRSKKNSKYYKLSHN